MNEKIESHKYDSGLVRSFMELDGQFVLFDESRQIALVTDSWDEILTAYRNRPAYVYKWKHAAEVNPKHKIDLSKLEITI